MRLCVFLTSSKAFDLFAHDREGSIEKVGKEKRNREGREKERWNSWSLLITSPRPALSSVIGMGVVRCVLMFFCCMVAVIVRAVAGCLLSGRVVSLTIVGFGFGRREVHGLTDMRNKKKTELQPQVRSPKTLSDSHQRAAVSVQPARMRKELHPAERADGSHPDAHWREATSVPTPWLREEVLRREFLLGLMVRIGILTSVQSSSLARHRRIHTGKRPYKCAHDGCLKR